MDAGSPGVSDRWSAHSRTRIRFGVGTLEEVGDVASSLDEGDSALIVAGTSAVENGVVDACRGSLRESGMTTESITGVTSDPTVHEVDEVLEAIRESGFGVIVAIGGGSVMDAAKAAAAVSGGDGDATDYLTADGPLPTGSRPVVAVPTTAGTGAELSKGAIVSWPERSMKGGVRGDRVAPRAAVVDPSLTLTVPREHVSITGFDVFAHAVETFVSRKATPITETWSRRAVTAVCDALPKALDDPESIEPRVILSFHSMLMGYNLANASTCLPHRMQYPLGVMTGTPHAWGLAALYPAWMEATRSASPGRFERVASWMAEGLGHGEGAGADAVVELLGEFLENIDLTPDLSEAGVSEEDCSELADRVGGTVENDPWWREGRRLADIFAASL